MALYTAFESPTKVVETLCEVDRDLANGKVLAAALGVEDPKERIKRAAARKVAALMVHLGSRVEAISSVKITEESGKFHIFIVGALPTMKWNLPLEVPAVWVAPPVAPKVEPMPRRVWTAAMTLGFVSIPKESAVKCDFCKEIATAKVDGVPVCAGCRKQL